MKWKIFYKYGAKLCSVLFYVIGLIGIFTLVYHLSYLMSPTGELAKSFGAFDPVYSNLTLVFDQQPLLYKDEEFIVLSLVTSIIMFVFALIFLRLMRKLLQNLHQESLFMMENVKILFKMGITILVLGSAFTFMDELLMTKALKEIHVTNASVTYTGLAYVDTFFTGIFVMILASALKVAVEAVEENKHTI
ncbi:MAG: DUF2975 domain-containing protein [Bacillota bacterium]|uniref:DUF2975 domain-containing protein n=1 Tax=Fictibacillus sp. 18YEL24 TaxID=2745875 RepID=UPI0018CDD43D|nr:DUF2975 domain-containing protein [Fictibacillus sp. 18YEL24]MBH0170216.1 DUF2975 domain-containing protein [Fictibacillus sp. 18YEL24]